MFARNELWSVSGRSKFVQSLIELSVIAPIVPILDVVSLYHFESCCCVTSRLSEKQTRHLLMNRTYLTASFFFSSLLLICFVLPSYFLFFFFLLLLSFPFFFFLRLSSPFFLILPSSSLSFFFLLLFLLLPSSSFFSSSSFFYIFLLVVVVLLLLVIVVVVVVLLLLLLLSLLLRLSPFLLPGGISLFYGTLLTSPMSLLVVSHPLVWQSPRPPFPRHPLGDDPTRVYQPPITLFVTCPPDETICSYIFCIVPLTQQDIRHLT